MSNTLAPICLFTYKRLQHTQMTVEALQKNWGAENSHLFVFSDGAKNSQDEQAVQNVRAYINQIKGFGNITLIQHTQNQGLAKSIIQGVNRVIQQYGKVIVLEDDILTSPNFLAFVNQALDFYAQHPQVFSVAGYTFPINLPKDYKWEVYFAPRASSWGWGTWQDRWEAIDWEVSDFETLRKNAQLRQKFNQGGSDMYGMLKQQIEGKIDSWAICWGYHQFKVQQQTVFPILSKVQNIGFGDKATHTKTYNRFATTLDNGSQQQFSFPKEVRLNPQIMRSFRRKFSLLTRIIGRLRYYLGI